MDEKTHLALQKYGGREKADAVCASTRRRGVKERTLTRRDFLKVAGAGAAGATMLGAAGCGSLANSFTQVPDEYLPSGGSRMNVILVIIDSLRRDHLGVYGN
ncbi:MAG TPA: twin-arginine translocation signal domain-containing protein, partial [Rubrobacter sp.]|nr:twin-arginine translocation signal domain-containing protein [Rubrobacter sp.]